MHQKQNRKVHQKQDRYRSSPETGQGTAPVHQQLGYHSSVPKMAKCTRNMTATEVHQSQDRELHKEQDKYRSAPENEQTHECTRKRTKTEVHQQQDKQRSAPER